MLNIDPFLIRTIQELESCSEKGSEQLKALDEFMERNRLSIETALTLGLTDETDGHNVALKLLKLQSDRLNMRSTVSLRRSTAQKPLEESRFFLAVIGQVFRNVGEWMRINNVGQITVESLPDLEEHITLDLMLQNGYRATLNEGR